MHRRRLLAAAATLLAGCTGTAYRASGPRTPPPAPARTDTRSTLAPSDERAQAVVAPLNDLYRAVRRPLAAFEFADADATIERASESLAAARGALSTATAEGLPEGYESLPALVEAHAHLLAAFEAGVAVTDSIGSLLAERAGDSNAGTATSLRERLPAARDSRSAMATAATDLVAVADGDPSVPPSLFLTTARMRTIADAVAEQARALSSLLDAFDAVLAADAAWAEAVAALQAGDDAAARSRFGDASDAYRTASETLGYPLLDGSFEPFFTYVDCAADAGQRAVETVLDAVAAEDDARASDLLASARTERRRCELD